MLLGNGLLIHHAHSQPKKGWISVSTANEKTLKKAYNDNE